MDKISTEVQHMVIIKNRTQDTGDEFKARKSFEVNLVVRAGEERDDLAK